MPATLTTFAEAQASKATLSHAFSRFSLVGLKSELEQMLSFIRQSGFFFQYTQHDIGHIDAMLGALDWLLPSSTREKMTPADWLLVVLAIYFHDLGMLVTKDEFEHRFSSDFPRYRDKELMRGAGGEEYAAKIATLKHDEAERFMYEEFVRHNHARRIAAWVKGKVGTSMGAADRAAQEVDSLLRDLPLQFRLDLALVCESHHLDDLDRLDKYSLSQPYGNSPEETANVHYAALLLRAADLLHITRDRTPSTIFRLIAPTDPLSQREWAKQMGVTCVRAEMGRDSDDNVDPNAPRNTIGVHGHFLDPNGFFGLTTFLSYAQTELQRTYDWAQIAKREGSTYEFPWRYIDTSGIKVKDFLPAKCSFEIDQKKVIDLLTGHALYNDANVVIRELIQNALDAVRLQALIDNKEGEQGRVRVHWDSANRCLTVEDNGTGMTQTIIENHLLKIGASRYKADDFLQRYPSFSSISRFGIGILSTFMVANRVEITTCHPDETTARQLMLRSVHGQFLIKLLDKESDADASSLAPHGSRFRIWVRDKAELHDIDDIVRHWIVFPRCRVTTQTDDEPEREVGYDSPRAALQQALMEIATTLQRGNHATPVLVEKDEILVGDTRMKVVEDVMGGVTLAYCVYWDELFDDWHFVNPDRLSRSYGRMGQFLDLDRLSRAPVPVEQLSGTCIEGVRVEQGTPGFHGFGIMAIADVCGQDAPKTNVARSGIEESGKRVRMLEAIYDLYCQHIQREFNELTNRRGKPLEWAVGESRYLLRPLTASQPVRGRIYGLYGQMREDLSKPGSNPLMEAACRLPLLVVERDGERVVQSIDDLRREPYFWTIHAMLTWHAESLLKETSSQLTLLELLRALGVSTENTVRYPALPNYEMTIKHAVLRAVFRDREVDALMANDDQRRIDVRWAERKSGEPKWQPVIDESVVARSNDVARRRGREQQSTSRRGDTWGHEQRWGPLKSDASLNQCIVPVSPLECEGFDSYTAARIGDEIYLFPGTPLADYLATLLTTDSLDEEVRAVGRVLLNNTIRYMRDNSGTLPCDVTAQTHVTNSVLEPLRDTFPDCIEQIHAVLCRPELEDIISSWQWKLFDPFAWRREGDFGDA